jgi:FixJ family two-component response regulator
MTEKFKTQNIFLVDDDKFYSEFIIQQLKNEGFQNIHNFYSGKECLQNVHLNPNLILLDYNMSGLSGTEVLKRLKRKLSHAEIIILSAQEDQTVAVNLMKYGAFDYIIKGENEIETIHNVLMRASEKIIHQHQTQPAKKKAALSIFGFLNF